MGANQSGMAGATPPGQDKKKQDEVQSGKKLCAGTLSLSIVLLHKFWPIHGTTDPRLGQTRRHFPQCRSVARSVAGKPHWH